MYNIFTWYAHFLSVSVHYDPGAFKTHHELQKSEECVKSIIQCIYKVIITIFLIQVHQLNISWEMTHLQSSSKVALLVENIPYSGG